MAQELLLENIVGHSYCPTAKLGTVTGMEQIRPQFVLQDKPGCSYFKRTSQGTCIAKGQNSAQLLPHDQS